MNARESFPLPKDGFFPPHSLTDIVGHASTVKRVRSRFARDRHETPLLLYGPDGVGKKTIARMYAKALLCPKGRDDRSLPCGECSTCAAGPENNFDYLQIDAWVKDGKEKVRHWIRAAPIGVRHVLIIERFDEAPPDFVDALLKPLEDEQDPIAPTTIILLAKDLEDVRQAGQSRCDVERLWPLAEHEVAELSTKAIASFKFEGVTDEFRRSLILGSRGLPSLAVGALRAASHGGYVNAACLRRELGIDWANEACHYWLDLLAGTRSNPSFVREDNIAGGQVTLRLRWIWKGLWSFMVDGSVGAVDEPALYFVDGSILQQLKDLLSEKASHMKMTNNALWSVIAEVLLQEEYADGAGHDLLVARISSLVLNGR